MSVSFKNETIYSQTIDYIYPDNKISFGNIQKFFSDNNLKTDENILLAMKNNYGKELTKETLKKKDLQIKFSSSEIKKIIDDDYSTNKATDTEIIYNTIHKFNKTLTQEDITTFIKTNNLEKVDSFSNYILEILQNETVY